MLKNDDLISVYNDYDSPLYANSSDPRGIDWVFKTKVNDEPYMVQIPLFELRHIYRTAPNVIKNRYLRICEEQEAEIMKLFNIDLSKEKDSFTREEIEEMLIHPTNHVIETILKIKSKDIIDRFLQQLVYLKNINKYHISGKVEEYIRARKEELASGVINTELEGQETLNDPVVNDNVDIAVIEEKEVYLTEKEEKLKALETALKEKEEKLKADSKKFNEAKKKLNEEKKKKSESKKK